MARFGLPHPDKKEIIIPTEVEKWVNEHCIVIGTIQRSSGWCVDKYGMSKECILEMLDKIKNRELKLQ